MGNDARNPSMMPDAPRAAAEIARKLSERGIEYAIGGALALGCWTSRPRATIDADINLFFPANDSGACLELLREIDCEVDWAAATATLRSHGFCRVRYLGRQIDFFLPTIDFYEEARRRRVTIQFGDNEVDVLDAETICVFKLMFFRTQDLADIEAMLIAQGSNLDRAWIEQQIEQLFGGRDPRVARWRELAAAFPPDKEQAPGEPRVARVSDS